jgi:polar amino acid transport system substrate-binding protein
MTSTPTPTTRLSTRRLLLALCACTAWLCAAPASAQTAPAAPLQLCYERADILPWRTMDDTGLNFDLINMAARKAQLAVNFVALPWKRCLAELQAQKMDGVIGASFSEDRKLIGAFPGGDTPQADARLHVDGYRLIRRKGDAVSWDGKRFENLNGPVGAQLGYSVVAQLKGLGVAVDDGSQTATELVQKLLSGRLAAAAVGSSDALVLSRPGAPYAERIEVVAAPLVEKPYFLMLSHDLVKQRPAVAQRLWQAIADSRQSPEYRQLERAAVR